MQEVKDLRSQFNDAVDCYEKAFRDGVSPPNDRPDGDCGPPPTHRRHILPLCGGSASSPSAATASSSTLAASMPEYGLDGS
jgi:hypothetical protein